MCVIVDMIGAVAIKTVALGAVTEIQLWVAHIGAAAYCALVTVWRGLLLGILVPMERNDPVTGTGAAVVVLRVPMTGLQKIGKYLEKICTEKEEIVQQRHNGEEIGREGISQRSINGDCEIEPGQIFQLDRNDIEEQDPLLREKRGKSQKQ